jgi:hypothetical protein
VALARFEHLAGVVVVGREPEYGGVGHDVFDEPGSDYLAVCRISTRALISRLQSPCYAALLGSVSWAFRFWSKEWQRPMPGRCHSFRREGARGGL